MKWPFRWNPFEDKVQDEYDSIVDDMVNRLCELLDEYKFKTFTYNPEIVDTHVDNSDLPVEIKTTINNYKRMKYPIFTCNGDIKVHIDTQAKEAKTKIEKNFITITTNDKDFFVLNAYQIRKISASVKLAGVKSRLLAAKKAAEKIGG